jgi:hypothetical protein
MANAPNTKRSENKKKLLTKDPEVETLAFYIQNIYTTTSYDIG